MKLSQLFSATPVCTLCQQPIKGPPFTAQLMVSVRVETVHLGQVLPAFCRSCGQLLPEGMEKDHNFRRRLRRFIRRQHRATAQ